MSEAKKQDMEAVKNRCFDLDTVAYASICKMSSLAALLGLVADRFQAAPPTRDEANALYACLNGIHDLAKCYEERIEEEYDHASG